MTSWSYCSRGKWRIDYPKDHSHRFEALRDIFKTFHEAYTIFYVDSVAEAILKVSREIFNTFCDLFLLLNDA